MPETRYAKSGDVNIAYQVVGDGPVDVVIAPGTVSHVEVNWEVDGIATLVRSIAERARVLVFDKRGTGMSDRIGGAPTLEERSDDIRAVMDAVGSRRAVVFGISEGVPMSVTFAASHPERASALVLYGGMARTLWAPDYPMGVSERDYRRMIDEEMEAYESAEGLDAVIRTGAPDASTSELRGLQRLFRYGASPGAVESLERMNMSIDVRDVLPVVAVPALVLHRRGDPWLAVEHGRYIADHLPAGRYVELDGDEHIISSAHVDDVLREILPFLEEVGTLEPPAPESVLATILFSDIVGSTSRAAELGDRAWRDVLARHHSAVRAQLARFRGAELDTAGDGFFARFDGPARAIRCACAIRDDVRALGLDLRLGVHTGECQLLDGKVAGIAVSIGARVAAHAAAGEVLVSQTVKDLVAGSGIAFDDRGPAELKGVPGEWRLYAVADAAA